MSITAKYASRCGGCGNGVKVGEQIEWTKGQPVRHTTCAAPVAAGRRGTSGRRGTWDPTQFRGYGRPKGGYAKACPTAGNCSSFGDGRSCGSPDCDGWG